MKAKKRSPLDFTSYGSGVMPSQPELQRARTEIERAEAERRKILV